MIRILSKAAWRDISDITGAKDGFRQQANEAALVYFKRSATLEPGFAPASAAVAESLYSLKRYSEAIPFYDKAIELEPRSGGAYNDRGLSKTYANDQYGAISDFSKAIEVGGSQLESTYENRAAAYLKVRRYDEAAADFSRVIGIRVASLIYLMPLSQIRSMYPELGGVSDADLLEGLRQKYFPNIAAPDFVRHYAENDKPFQEFVIADDYAGRGDAYLRSLYFMKAAREYHRAKVIYDSVDRWRVVAEGPGTEYAVDLDTLELSGTRCYRCG